MNLHEKLIELRKELDYFQKTTDSYKYKYVPGVNILAKMRPKMDELKLLLIPEVTGYETDLSQPKKQTVMCNMIWTWIDAETDEKLPVQFPAFGQQDDLSKAFGSALTYSERYFLLKFFQIQTDEDDPDKFKKKNKPKKETTKAQPPNPGTITATKAEIDNMKKTATAAGWPSKEVFPFITYVYGIEKPEQVKELSKAQVASLTKTFADPDKMPTNIKPIPDGLCTIEQNKKIWALSKENNYSPESLHEMIMNIFKKEHIFNKSEPDKTLTVDEAGKLIEMLEGKAPIND